ncbi:hypothetical protein HYW43_04655 [Candidatus Daviesbacteria bacterium]|nr:hypothetical protein [Candidatus Daviesbacteria bacterium]
MNLPTEAERRQAFVKVYGNTEEVDDPSAGISKTGFTLSTFDPETGYAQFCSNSKPWLGASRERVEFAVDPNTNIPIRRGRFYLQETEEQTPKLQWAKLNYPLGRFTVRLKCNYEGQFGGTQDLPDFLSLVVVAQNEGEVRLAECRYLTQLGEWPTMVSVITGTIEEAEERQKTQVGNDRSKVADAMDIRIIAPDKYKVFGPEEGRPARIPNLGSANLGEKLSCRKGFGELGVNISGVGQSEVLEISKVGKNSQVHLVIPKFTPGVWDRGIRGDWRSYVELVKTHPTRFEYTEQS